MIPPVCLQSHEGVLDINSNSIPGESHCATEERVERSNIIYYSAVSQRTGAISGQKDFVAVRHANISKTQPYGTGSNRVCDTVFGWIVEGQPDVSPSAILILPANRRTTRLHRDCDARHHCSP